MNVSLTPELEKYVNDKVKTGRYNSASEVIRESLRTLQDQDELQRIRRDELRREIMLGVDSIRNGKGIRMKASELDAFAEKLIQEARDEYGKRSNK
ncbi:MAG: type II toxin-antitoxin system ParD family antitoxin [Pyrinomonadaceae bacterium]